MASEKFYLLLGEADRESVTANLKNSGVEYRKKRLDSSLENWDTIYPLIEDGGNIGVIAKLSNQTIRRMFSEHYQAATDCLLLAISKKKHIFFVHESFYTSNEAAIETDNEDDITDWYLMHGSVDDESRSKALNAFDRYEIDVRSYQTIAAFSIETVEFINDINNNLIFRMYVSDKKMWSSEIRKIIGLFRDYLSKVCGTSVKQQEFTTPSGCVFELSTESDAILRSVPARFAEFTEFMDASAGDVQRATQMLVDRKVSQTEAESIVHRFAKEARRLQVDLKQERERKILDVRHRLESELTDVVETQQEWSEINSLVDEMIPDIYSISGAMGIGNTSSPKPLAGVTMISPQFIQTVNGVVAQAINGNQNFGLGADELLKLIEKFGGSRSASLISDLHELEDQESRPDRRTSARARIMAFLGRLGDKATDSALAAAQAYIQSALGIRG